MNGYNGYGEGRREAEKRAQIVPDVQVMRGANAPDHEYSFGGTIRCSYMVPCQLVPELS